MKRAIILYMFCCAAGWLHAQEIISAEYFIDTEPGIGLGAPLSLSPGDSIEFTANIPYQDLADGFHYIHLRVMNELGLWSLNEHRAFYVVTQPLIDNTIVAGEYFIDTEPGIGNGIPITINSPADSVQQTFAVPIDDIPPGFHTVHFRFRNQTGHWSLNDFRNFFVIPVEVLNQDIVAGEFFIDVEPGIVEGTHFIIPSPSDSLDADVAFELPALSMGPHILYVRLLNEDGHWSMNEPRTFNICETYGSVALYSYVENGGMAFFTNESLYADSILWNFGDGNTSELQDPIHQYQGMGTYNVSLITYNDCAWDTLQQTITVEGVQSVWPQVVTNTSLSTLTINGFGFVPGTSIMLTREGQSDISPLNTGVLNTSQVNSLINFIGTDPGMWNLVVTIPGQGTFTLADAIQVTSAEFVNANLYMTVQKVNLIRTGRRAPGIIKITNDNLSDAIGTPVLFRDKDIVNQIVYNDLSPLTSTPFFIEAYQYLLDNGLNNTLMQYNVIHDATQSKIGAFIIPKIPGQTYNETLLYTNRSGDGIHQRGSLFIYPQLDAVSQLGTPVYQNSFCISSFMKHAVETTFTIIIADNEWDDCFNHWNDSLWKTVSTLAFDSENYQKPIPMGACITSLFSHMMDEGCIPGIGAATTEDVRNIISSVMGNIAYLDDAEEITMSCPSLQGMEVESGLSSNSYYRENEFCDEVASFGGTGIFTSLSAASAFCQLNSGAVDPNTKTGPGDNDLDVFIDPGDETYYNIFFENDSAATAPAESVMILDSLDRDKFRMSTFRWGPVAMGDSIVISPDGMEHHQVLLDDLRPGMPYFLKSEFEIDTTSGVISWSFTTLDTLNLQPLDLELGGFLPPNMDGIEGAGVVSFYLRLSEELLTGDTILNNAHITFDLDDPIVTGHWMNVIDETAPNSQVDALPGIVDGTSFEVNWNGVDSPAGISTYTIFVSENDGPFIPWILFSDSTNAEFEGSIGNIYKFYSVAIDNAGNIEEAPDDPWTNYDAVTELIDGVTEYENVFAVSVYPVPANERIYCRFTLPGNSPARLTVMDLNGKVITTKITRQRTGVVTESFDTSTWPDGIYMIRIDDGIHEASAKLIRH